jgi:hypothetical protein
MRSWSNRTGRRTILAVLLIAEFVMLIIASMPKAANARWS